MYTGMHQRAMQHVKNATLQLWSVRQCTDTKFLNKSEDVTRTDLTFSTFTDADGAD